MELYQGQKNKKNEGRKTGLAKVIKTTEPGSKDMDKMYVEYLKT